MREKLYFLAEGLWSAERVFGENPIERKTYRERGLEGSKDACRGKATIVREKTIESEKGCSQVLRKEVSSWA